MDATIAEPGNVSTLLGPEPPCECPAFGFCKRYGRFMPPHHHAACMGKVARPEMRDQILAEIRGSGPVPRSAEPSMPSLAEQAANYASAVVKHAKNGFARTTDAERDRRLALCGSCEFLNHAESRCSKCGCPIAKKASWQTEACPANKWVPGEITAANPIVPVPDEDDLLLVAEDVEGMATTLSTPAFYHADGSAKAGPELAGRTAVLLCGGPSLSGMDLTLIPLLAPGSVTMGLNNVARLIRTDLWMSIDEPGNFPAGNWLDDSVMKFVPRGWRDTPIARGFLQRVKDCPNVHFFICNHRFRSDRFLPEPSFSVGNDAGRADEFGLAGSRSVLLPALKALHVLGARTIVIVGADFNMRPERPYAHDEPKDADGCLANNAKFRSINIRLAALNARFLMAGTRVINATPGGSLTAFERMPLADALRA